MENLTINNLNQAATRTTPRVVFDSDRNTLELTGQSYPEDSLPFYRNIEKELEAYLADNHAPFTVIFKLDYYNTSSSKCLLDLLERLEKVHQEHRNISVQWHYAEDDEDMYDSGVDFSTEVKLPFQLKPIID